MPLYSPFPGFATDAEARAQTAIDRALTPANLAGRAMFRATMAGDQAGMVSGTPTKIAFATEDYDIGGFYDHVLYRWTPPTSKVRLTARLFLTGAMDVAKHLEMYIYRNGAPFATLFIPLLVNGGSAEISAIANASGADYFEAYATAETTAGTVTCVGSFVSNCVFAGEQI